MSHKKSTRVWYCPIIEKNIMASHCHPNKCNVLDFNNNCGMEHYFNSCKLVSINNKKDIDKALK